MDVARCLLTFVYFACDVTLSVYPHRASLKNMPDHGGNRTYDLWNTSPMLCQLSYAVRSVRVCGYTLRYTRCGYTRCGYTRCGYTWCGYTLRVTSQASYSPEYITPTQKNHDYY